MLRVLATFSAVILLSGFTSSAVSTQEVRMAPNGFVVDRVNDVSFLFNATDAGAVVHFHSADLSTCSLSFIAKKFSKGYKAKTEKLGEGELDLTCLVGKDHFSLSPIFPSYASMEVLEDTGQGRIILSFSLFSVKKKSSIEYKNVTLNLSESQTRALASWRSGDRQ